MSRIRSSLILLALAVGALIVSWIQVARDTTRLPVGSSYSFQDDGAQALYEWSRAVGAQPVRLQQPVIDPSAAPKALLILQPETVAAQREQEAFNAVPQGGGTLILVGDSLALQIYSRQLGVDFQPAQVSARAVTAEGQELGITSRGRLRVADATPLLTAANGDLLALQKPYLNGALIVLATPQPLTNAALRDERIARFVYQQVLAPVGTATIAFDEAHHSYTPPTADQPATLDRLLYGTAPGRAVIYIAMLAFLYLLLSGRRLGPPIAERTATETHRTMYEHVQMLASLYRRAGQLGTVRNSFERHYQRLLARGALAPSQSAALGDALIYLHDAHSEHDLISAVGAAEQAVNPS
jgi:hypothetical protein